MLKVKSICKKYNNVQALDNVSFELNEGQILGIVGESGSGKSTLAKVLLHLTSVDSGDFYLYEEKVTQLNTAKLRKYYQQVQMVFQSPQNAFDPRQRLGDSIIEILENNGVSRQTATARMIELLSMVGLDKSFIKRYPSEASGGQCQRIAIARALAINPKLLVCDEITSALDVSSQIQIINLLKQLQGKLALSIIFISHDLAVVQKFCDSVIVMHDGKIIEQGSTEQIINRPQNEYTKSLIEAVL